MFKVIVAGTDGSARAHRAVRAAAEMAARFDGELHLVRGYRPPSNALAAAAGPEAGLNLVEVDPVVRREVEQDMAGLAAELAAIGARNVRWHTLPIGAVDSLLRVTVEVGADLVVVGNKGMQGARRLLGSVPNAITHQAPCSVLVIDTGAD